MRIRRLVMLRHGQTEWNAGSRMQGQIDTDLTGVFRIAQAAARGMTAAGTGGSIVNIASISGLRASTLRGAYGTSKAGVIHLTQQQAAEWGEFGVRANCVCPGPVRTKLAMAVHTQEIIDAGNSVRDDVIYLSHGGPISTPEDAAYVNEHTDAVGFVGASSLERMAVEEPLTNLTKEFKAIPVKRK